MPTAKIYVHKGRYDEQRLAIQEALESVLRVPPGDSYRVVHVLPSHHFVHKPSFFGLSLWELSSSRDGRKSPRLSLLKELNDRVVAATSISQDDLCVPLCELPGENNSFGQGLAQGALTSADTSCTWTTVH